MDLLELVQNDVLEVLLARSPNDPDPIRLPASAVSSVGFESDECIFPAEPRTFSGYRLLTEYFAAPEKLCSSRCRGSNRNV